jgi:hypothetical protein
LGRLLNDGPIEHLLRLGGGKKGFRIDHLVGVARSVDKLARQFVKGDGVGSGVPLVRGAIDWRRLPLRRRGRLECEGRRGVHFVSQPADVRVGVAVVLGAFGILVDFGDVLSFFVFGRVFDVGELGVFKVL